MSQIPLDLSKSCFWAYYDRCLKTDCTGCISYKNIHDTFNRKEESIYNDLSGEVRESRLIKRILNGAK